MNHHEITAASVFVEVDGRLCMAPIANLEMLLRVLPAAQSSDGLAAKLIVMPKEVADLVRKAGEALQQHRDATVVAIGSEHKWGSK